MILVNKLKLEKLFKDFLASHVFSEGKKDLHDFIDTLPGDIFNSQGSSIVEVVCRSKEESESFKKFLISSGFGDESSFNSVAAWCEEYLCYDFDTSKSPICEFILKDCLNRRYNIALDTIPLSGSGIKRVTLGDPITAKFEVLISFRAVINSELYAENNQSAVYTTFSKYAKFPLSSVLGIGEDSMCDILDLRLVRHDNITALRVGDMRFDVEYPFIGEARIVVSSSGASEYDMYLEACKKLRDACNSELRINWVKFSMKECVPVK